MSQSFSTDVVPISERLDAWLWNARQICGDCRFQFPRRYPFHGSIHRRTVAGFELTRFSSSPVSFAKFPAAGAGNEDRGCIIVTQLEGVRHYHQDGAVALLKPGDTTLIDSGRPWTSDCIGSCSRLYLRVARWFLQNRLRIISVPVLPRISGASGLGASLFHLATSLYEEADEMSIEEGMAGVEAYLDLLSGCVGRPALVSVGHSAELLSRIERFIEAHLPDPTLNPGEIATVVDISVRHLHRLFAVKGCTVADWIRHRRLDRCRLDLSNFHLRNRSITDIAFLWGFSDSAHFSRCFRKEFGESPRAYRSRVWAVSWNSREDEPVQSFASSGKSFSSQSDVACRTAR